MLDIVIREVSGNEVEERISDSRYDWLRITMVSHGHDDNDDGIPDKHFGGGNGVEKQLIKLQFKINDVADDFTPKSFRVLLNMMEVRDTTLMYLTTIY